jgi:ribosome-binding factor A
MRKVNELIREVVADQITELKDPRIGFVTVTGVDTAPDLRYATVFYSVLGTEEEQAATAGALSHAAPHIQRSVGEQTRLKFTPHLVFEVDPSIEQGLRIDALLQELEVERAPAAEDEE